MQFVGTLPLPSNPHDSSQVLTRGFSITFHPRKSQIFLTGKDIYDLLFFRLHGLNVNKDGNV